MTVAQALAAARERLNGASASSDAPLLLAFALRRDPGWLIAHDRDAIDEGDWRRFQDLLERRATGVPFAYVVGEAGFYGRRFLVNDAVLVPRPETEHLIDEAVAFLQGRARPRVLDVGTGSGAIAVTLALEVGGATIEATDVSEAALRVAAGNARRHGVDSRIAFRRANLADGAAPPFQAIVANLPYIPAASIRAAPDALAYEPRLALDGGEDGLDLYRQLVPALPGLLAHEAVVLLEAAPPTMHGLLDLARRVFPSGCVRAGKDYAGLERYVRVNIPA